MRRLQAKRFTELVLAVRVAEKDEPEVADAGAPQGFRAGTPKSVVGERARTMTDELYSKKGKLNFNDVAWMTERQFRGHFKTMEDMSTIEVEAKWLKESQDPAVPKRRNAQGQLMLPVVLAEKGRTFKELGHKRAFLDEQDDSDDSADPNDRSGYKKLRTHAEELGTQDCVLHSDAHASGVRGDAMPPKVTKGVSSTTATLKAMSSAGDVEGANTGDASSDLIPLPDEESLHKMGLVKARCMSCHCESRLCKSPSHSMFLRVNGSKSRVSETKEEEPLTC